MMFDVDCPNTPDGNSPKATPSRPPSVARRIANSRVASANNKVTPRIRSSNSYDHNRGRSTSYDYGRATNVGLEPEEVIHQPARPRAPSSGGLYRAAPPANPSTPPSNNPFDDDKSLVRGRTHSENWWREEIVNEREDKSDVLDGYYGLSEKDKQEFYGKSNNPFQKGVNKHGHTSFQVHKSGDVAVGIGIDQDGSIESSLVDTQEPVNPQAARRAAQAAMQKVDQRHHDMTNSSLYQQAAAMRNNGHYHVDDYSFSTINIHNIPKDDVGSPKKYDGSNNSSFLKMPKWMESFAPGVANSKNTPSEYGFPAEITKDTNLAPPIRGNHQDWWSNSPKVTFDTDYPDKRSKWSSLSHSQKIGAGVIWVALMCTLMGVTVWSLNKPPQEVYEGDRSSSLTGFVPGAVPTLNPTSRPTRPPVSRSPVSGYSSLHGKGSATSPRPSRSPITSRPSNSPVVSPSSSPSLSPSSLPSTSPSVSVNACTDDEGYFLNHLMNPKDCYWLWNEKDGYTDRKDKNCGTSLYPQTDLGSACRATCAEYNGCITDMSAVTNEVAASNVTESISSSTNYGSIAFRSDETNYLTPSQVQDDASNAQMCSDVNDRTFKNHLDSDKTCEWLDNDKPGQTERKDKNCGYGSYPITELGLNCPQTCIWYNKSGCSPVPVRRSIEPNLRAGSTSSTGCVNGSGKYANHHGQHKQCQWLHEPESPNIEKFRQDKNCGTEEHPITDLGIKCPWSCKEYNGCSELRN